MYAEWILQDLLFHHIWFDSGYKQTCVARYRIYQLMDFPSFAKPQLLWGLASSSLFRVIQPLKDWTWGMEWWLCNNYKYFEGINLWTQIFITVYHRNQSLKKTWLVYLGRSQTRSFLMFFVMENYLLINFLPEELSSEFPSPRNFLTLKDLPS